MQRPGPPHFGIATRLSLALSAAAVVLFGLFGYHLISVERQQYRAAVEREVRLLGRSLQVSIENALRDGQLPDVIEVLEQVQRVDPTVDVALYGRDGEVKATTGSGGPFTTSLRVLARRVLVTRETVLRLEDPGPPLRALFATPLLTDQDVLLGVMVLARPLADMEADIALTSREIALTAALLVALSVLITFLLGRAYIHRPLRRLARAMRVVRGGDLEAALAAERADEIGHVANEFNAMVADLRDTRRRLDAETEARRRLERGLRDVEKLAAIGQLAAGLAHEIGSPLQVLTSRARGLRGCAERPEEVQRIAGILAGQTERITRIVQQLLTFARRRPPCIDDVDLRPTVGAILDLLELEARRQEVTLDFTADRDVPVVRADADQIQQVTFNLVRNALAASGPGGRVCIDLQRATHHPLGLPAPVPAVRLVIEDTGRGIPEALQGRLFEPFFTTRGEEGGTGLGLAVVRSIVEFHHGTITFRSSSAGTRFDVVLPVAGPAALLREEAA